MKKSTSTVYQLTPDQLEELAQSYLTEHYHEYNPDAAELEGPSYGELATALDIVGRETLEEEYSDTTFTVDDFFCSAPQPERYEVRQVDAWAEYDDPDEAPAWTYNTTYRIGSFATYAEDIPRAIRYYLKSKGITFNPGRTRTEYDGDIYEIVDRKTGEPLFCAVPQA